MADVFMRDVPRQRRDSRGCLPSAARLVGQLRGRVCDLPAYLLDQMAAELRVAAKRPKRLEWAQQQVDESAQALRGEA